MTLDKRLVLKVVWLFAALAIVFAPALDGPELTGFERLALTETLGPRILAPASHESVAQDDRSATRLFTGATTTLQGLLAFFALPAVLLAAVAAAQTESAVRSQIPGSPTSSRGPPSLAS